MKLEAGGKPWRRKPSAAPAVSAARTRRRCGRATGAITASVSAGDHADPGREAVHPVDEVDHVDDRDDPDHRRGCRRGRPCRQRQLEQLDRAGSSPPRKGRVKASTRDARQRPGSAPRPSGRASLTAAGRSKTSSSTPTRGDHRRAGEDRTVSRRVSRAARSPPRRGRRRGSRGRRASGSARRAGCARSGRRSRRSGAPALGQRDQQPGERPRATRKAKRASIVSGFLAQSADGRLALAGDGAETTPTATRTVDESSGSRRIADPGRVLALVGARAGPDRRAGAAGPRRSAARRRRPSGR